MLKTTVEKFRRRLRGKTVAYARVFDRNSVFTSEVLADIAKFCRAHETTFHADPRIHAVLEGRREVWLMIERNLNLSPEELLELYKIRELNEGE